MSKMYVYITASTERTKKNKYLFRHLLKSLSRFGFKNSNEYINSIIRNTPNPDSNKKDFHIRTRKRIKKAELLLADISDPSVTIGTLIEYAISNNIPVLCLCEKRFKKDLPAIMKYYDSRLFTLYVYEEKRLDPILQKYFETFKRGKVKFNAFFTPELDSYLKWYSTKYRVSKSDYVRDLLINKMKNDKEYRKTLPNNKQ